MTTKTNSSTAERILAIDVGGTGLKAAIVGVDGQMKTDRLRVATPSPCTPDVLVDALVEAGRSRSSSRRRRTFPSASPASCAITTC